MQQAPHANAPPFFQPRVAKPTQTVIHPRHRSLPRIITQLTESAIKFLRNMCEFDSRKLGEVKMIPAALTFPS
ncbi:hypothetical protein ACVW1A_003643 [Bradyrhizobium sp. LB1.3]